MRAVSPGLTAGLAAVAALLAAATWFGLMGHAARYQNGQIVDTPTYFAYADRTVGHHQLPYDDYRVEYPPLAFAVFLPPRLDTSDMGSYGREFTNLMGVLLMLTAATAVLAAAAAGLGVERVTGVGILAATGPALAGSVALTRYDLWPVFLVTAAIWAYASASDGAGGFLLGLGAAAKLWPALALPAFAALAWRRGGRRALQRTLMTFAIGLGVPLAVAFVLSPAGLWHSLTVQAERPLQIESLAASALVFLAHHGLGGPYRVVTSSGSQNLSGASVSVATTLTTLATAGAIAWCWIAGVRAVRSTSDARASVETACRYAFAAIVASIAVGKVLSPQFVLWLLPWPLLVGTMRGKVAWSLSVATLILTQIEFPSRYFSYAVGFDSGTTEVILLRNVCLVALLICLLLPERLRGDVALT